MLLHWPLLKDDCAIERVLNTQDRNDLLVRPLHSFMPSRFGQIGYQQERGG